MKKEKVYVVFVGRKPDIYYSWEECNEQVSGYPGARHAAFTDRRKMIQSVRDEFPKLGLPIPPECEDEFPPLW
jgi:ribonuclease HI